VEGVPLEAFTTLSKALTDEILPEVRLHYAWPELARRVAVEFRHEVRVTLTLILTLTLTLTLTLALTLTRTRPRCAASGSASTRRCPCPAGCGCSPSCATSPSAPPSRAVRSTCAWTASRRAPSSGARSAFGT
jgi:hypothetical protein